MPITKDDLPTDLIKNFKENNAIFFVGAGLSYASGYPTWDKLLIELLEVAKKTKWIDRSKLKEYNKLINDSSKFLFLAEEFKDVLKSEYTKYMERRFKEEKHKPTKNHNLIVKTEGSLIITINYDRLLEVAFNNAFSDYPNFFTYSQPKLIANSFWKNEFFVLKAHGDAKLDIDNIILSQRDYRKTLYREQGYKSLLQTIFTTKSIFFVGVSLDDPEFKQLLDYLHDAYHGGGPRHYVLVEESKNCKTLEKGFLDYFNIETISFPNKKKDFKGITDVLKILNSEAPRTAI